MSESKHKDISRALSAAAGALLSGGASANLFDYDLGGEQWDAEAAFMLYSESDDRVSAVAPAVQLTRTIDTDETLTLRFTLDSLTGASPNGAVPSRQVQTFTGPSGGGAYRVEPGDNPLDDTFKDTRAAFNAAWVKPLNRDYLLTLGSNLSKEYDYLSVGASASIARDFYQRNTTLSAGFALSADTISAVGGTPTRFAAIPLAQGDDDDPDEENEDEDDDEARNNGGDESKTLTDLLFGWTQVIDRDSVLQLSLGLSQSDGYHTDPYKLISVVDSNGDPVVADAETQLSLALYENRPDTRNRQSIYAQYKRNFDGSILNTAYRYMQDDWEVQSHTLDVSYRFQVGAGWWQPRLRYYTQQAAEFYRPFYREGEQPAEGDNSYASADYRLGAMDATTVGLSYGRDGDRPWHLSMEYYLQTPEEPADKFGSLRDLTLAPEMSAVVLRLNLDL